MAGLNGRREPFLRGYATYAEYSAYFTAKGALPADFFNFGNSFYELGVIGILRFVFGLNVGSAIISLTSGICDSAGENAAVTRYWPRRNPPTHA